MSKQEILTKAIQKAIDGGWPGEYLGKLKVWQQDNGIVRIRNGLDEEWSVEEIIYNKKFAKALWGDGEGGDYYKLNDPKRTKRKLWEHMLQQMVIADDPIKYLGENM